jgi:hypothetical protein
MRRIKSRCFRAARLRRCVPILTSFLFIGVAFRSPAQGAIKSYGTELPNRTKLKPATTQFASDLHFAFLPMQLACIRLN